MRDAVLAVVLASGTASADRIPVLTFGATVDARSTGSTWDKAAHKDVSDLFGGGQLTLSFEDAPPRLLATHRGQVIAQAGLVPELIVGGLGNDSFLEGYLGAGVRAELGVASYKGRAGLYIAGRGLVIGAHRDSAAELTIGDYVMLHGMTRFGFEGGAMIRPADRDGNRELDAVMRVYAGWKL